MIKRLGKRSTSARAPGATRLHFVSVFIRLRRDESAWQASDDPPSFDFRRDRGCASHRTRQHCALSAMLTVSQLSKSFAGRALFDDVFYFFPRSDADAVLPFSA